MAIVHFQPHIHLFWIQRYAHAGVDIIVFNLSLHRCCAGLTPEGVHQSFHAQLMLHSQVARSAAASLSFVPTEQLLTLPEPLHSHARRMWLTSAVDVHVSKLQADVSNALLLAGIPNSMEWLTDDGLFSIDIAFQVDGQPVAVEVDGSHHYTNSVPHMPLSEVLVRRRLLQVSRWG